MKSTGFSRLLSAVLSTSAGLVIPATALTPVVLDDYSTNKSANYSPYRWNGATDATYAISGGLYTPVEAPGTGTGHYWTGGQALKPGDSVSAVVRPDKSPTFGTWVGLAISTTTSSSNPYRVMINYNLGAWRCVNEGGGMTTTTTNLGGSSPAWNTPELLTLTRGTAAQQNVISWALTQIGGVGLTGSGSLTVAAVTSADKLYFGTASYAANGAGSNNPAWDDLTYTDSTPPTPYLAWAGARAFNTANGEGIPNGLAWMLGGSTPSSANTIGLMPVGVFGANGAAFHFSRVHDIGTAKLTLEYGTNLGTWTRVTVPANLDGTNVALPDSDVTADAVRATPNDSITLRIPSTLTQGAKFFCRLSASEN